MLPLQWEDRMIPYSMLKCLIVAVIGVEENDNKALIYVKGFKKRELLADVLDSDYST